MGDLKAELFHAADHRGRRRGARGHHVDRAVERPIAGVEQRVHHNRRAAQMRDAEPLDRVVDRPGLDPAQTDMGPGERGHGPRKAPAVAMEHRQRPQIDRVLRHAPHQDVAERVQIGAAMVVDDALRVAGGARGVVERNRVPFVRRGQLGESGVAGGEEGLVIERAEALAAGPSGSAMSMTSGFSSSRARARPITGENSVSVIRILASPCLRMKAIVSASRRMLMRVEHGAGHRHAEMRLEGFRHIGRHQRHRVAAPDPARRQRRGQAAAALKALMPGVAACRHG